MVLLSITGLFKTILIIVGVMVLLRFIGRVMIAKRNLEEHSKVQRQSRKDEEMLEKSKRNFGKTILSKPNRINSEEGFTEYEEIKEED